MHVPGVAQVDAGRQVGERGVGCEVVAGEVDVAVCFVEVGEDGGEGGAVCAGLGRGEEKKEGWEDWEEGWKPAEEIAH